MSTLLGVIRTENAFRDLFGRDLTDDRERLLFRHWSYVIALAGALLIWAGAVPEYRVPILTFAIFGKGGVILMMLKDWAIYKNTQGKIIVLGDSVMVLLFITYLVAA
ncbi:MAG: hypothetical protein ACPG06_03760 [Alphaproteobacteria bacterium]